MAKKGYHSLFEKSKFSSKLPPISRGASRIGEKRENTLKIKKAAKKASKTQAARAESTFRSQPKAKKKIDPYGGTIPGKGLIDVDPKAGDKVWRRKHKAHEKQIKWIKEKRKKEKAKREKLSGGTRQSQKRKQGDY